MKKFVIDTNLILRLLLGDDENQFVKSKRYFEKASKGNFKLIVFTQVIFEIIYVLEKFYKLSRNEISEKILILINLDYLKIEERDILNKVFNEYAKFGLSAVDIYLLHKCIQENLGLLSFDKKLMKEFKSRA